MVSYQTIDDSAANQRLDNYLVKHLKGVPKSHVYRIIRKGEIRINKGRKPASYKLQINDVVRIPPIKISEKNALTIPNALKAQIKQSLLYEDDGLLIFNKACGLAVHGGSGIDLGMIETVRALYGKQLELVHRLDKNTSGCLLIAKKRSVLKNIQAQLQQSLVTKTYLALVKNSWAKKTHRIEQPLLKNILSSGERMVVVNPQGKKSRSDFTPIQNFQQPLFSASLVQIVIPTGRTHQIRVHAAYAKHPVAGDNKYGDSKFNAQLKQYKLKRLFLHASQLTFTNPSDGKKQTVSAPLCPQLQKTITDLNENNTLANND